MHIPQTCQINLPSFGLHWEIRLGTAAAEDLFFMHECMLLLVNEAPLKHGGEWSFNPETVCACHHPSKLL